MFKMEQISSWAYSKGHSNATNRALFTIDQYEIIKMTSIDIQMTKNLNLDDFFVESWLIDKVDKIFKYFDFSIRMFNFLVMFCFKLSK